MTVLETVLLIAGILCVAVSFLIKDGSGESLSAGDSQTKELTEQDKERIRKQVDEILEEEISNISEKTEAQLDKISNTKILEMNDYAETIMDEINRNHNETVFLYDMLNEKAKEVKSTVKDVNIAKREVARMQYESTMTLEEQKKLKSADTEGEDSKPKAAKQVLSYSNGIPTGAQASSIMKSGAKLQKTLKAEELANKSAGTGNSHNNHSKDLAKERLIELVRKSTENSKEMQRMAQLKVEPLKEADAAKTKAEPTKEADTDKATKKPTKEADVAKVKAEPLKEADTDKTKAEPLKETDAAKAKAEPLKETDAAKAKAEPTKKAEAGAGKAKSKPMKETEADAKVKAEPTKEVEAGKTKATPEAEGETVVKSKTTRKKTAKKAPEAESLEQKQEDINVNIQFDKNINKNEAIIDMYKAGMSNKEIAKQLNLGIGEVKLVIDLFKNTK